MPAAAARWIAAGPVAAVINLDVLLAPGAWVPIILCSSAVICRYIKFGSLTILPAAVARWIAAGPVAAPVAAVINLDVLLAPGAWAPIILCSSAVMCRSLWIPRSFACSSCQVECCSSCCSSCCWCNQSRYFSRSWSVGSNHSVQFCCNLQVPLDPSLLCLQQLPGGLLQVLLQL